MKRDLGYGLSVRNKFRQHFVSFYDKISPRSLPVLFLQLHLSILDLPAPKSQYRGKQLTLAVAVATGGTTGHFFGFLWWLVCREEVR